MNSKKITFILLIISILFISGCAQCPKSCDDQNLCTNDFCSKNTDFQCAHQNKQCNDNNQCTDDSCNQTTGQCTYSQIIPCQGNGVCEVDEYGTFDCPGCEDNNKCTSDSYNYSNQNCVHERMIPCCGNKICESGENITSCQEDCDIAKNLFFDKVEDKGRLTYSYNHETNLFLDDNNNIFWIQYEYDEDFNEIKNMYVYNIETNLTKLLLHNVSFEIFKGLSNKNHTILIENKTIYSYDGFLTKLDTIEDGECPFIYSDFLVCNKNVVVEFDCLSIASATSCQYFIKEGSATSIFLYDLNKKTTSYIYSPPEKSVNPEDFYNKWLLDLKGNYLHIHCQDVLPFSIIWRRGGLGIYEDPAAKTEIPQYAMVNYYPYINFMKRYCGIYDLDKRELIRTENPGKYLDEAFLRLKAQEYLKKRYSIDFYQNYIMDYSTGSKREVKINKLSLKDGASDEIFEIVPERRNTEMYGINYNGKYLVWIDTSASGDFDVPLNRLKTDIYYAKLHIVDNWGQME